MKSEKDVVLLWQGTMGVESSVTFNEGLICKSSCVISIRGLLDGTGSQSIICGDDDDDDDDDEEACIISKTGNCYHDHLIITHKHVQDNYARTYPQDVKIRMYVCTYV